MFRTVMPTGDGMLFVFEQPGQQCFWMKNTLIPLSVAFIADDGRIVNIDEMKPQTLDSHCSAKPVRYVLEMNQGWFARKGIKSGFKVSGEPFKTRYLPEPNFICGPPPPGQPAKQPAPS